ncbi:MAG TPA: T9SS type A sorting domain-containing protein [Bacteroidales bacterium]|nr:T9SS type A sorting domain-containing protein [Bacteroidales bacterium]
MKYIIFVLSLIISVSSFAQNDIPVKTDGTKYYIQIYDGDTNDKILYHNTEHAAWQTKIQVADFFDGSQNQLWSFNATEMFPGYFSVENYDETLSDEAFLMSWSWNAYMGANRDPSISPEMQYRLVEVVDGWYKFETIEKEDGLNNQPYTPGADALNINAEGFASFRDVKSADITPENMVNKAFKFVEFDPVGLFISAIDRSQELYDANPNAPEALRYDLFYIMEKARETRVFGTEAEMLAFQPKLDSVVNNFNEGVDLFNVVTDAKTFIEDSGAGVDVTNSFNAVIEEVETLLISEDVEYELIDEYQTKLLSAQDLVEAIVAAETYDETLQDLDDQRLSTGMGVSIDHAKAVLADIENDGTAYDGEVSLLQKKTELIDEIIAAQELIRNTAEFELAKQTLGEAVETAIIVANNPDATVTDLTSEITSLQDAVEIFKSVIEAGSIVAIENGGFENDFLRWTPVTDTSWLPYIENKGVDGSQNMTIWKGVDYQFIISQSIEGIPDGTYKISVMAQVSGDNIIELFAESGATVSELSLLNEGGLTKHSMEVEVANGMLQFGIRGAGENNGIPGNQYGVFDNFEIKWMSEFQVSNYDFENDFANWTVDANPAGAAYIENKGVDGSKSVTCWRGAEYSVNISQTLTGLSNGVYSVTAMTNSNRDGSFVVYGSSGAEEGIEDVLSTGALAETSTTLQVNDGTLEFGVKGGGENNTVPASHWIVFDNVEVEIDTITPDYVEIAGVPQYRSKQSDAFADKNDIDIWQSDSYLLIRSSSQSIVSYSVYSITGALVDSNKVRSQFLTIPMRKGMFVVKVITEDGSVSTKKIVIQ